MVFREAAAWGIELNWEHANLQRSVAAKLLQAGADGKIRIVGRETETATLYWLPSDTWTTVIGAEKGLTNNGYIAVRGGLVKVPPPYAPLQFFPLVSISDLARLFDASEPPEDPDRHFLEGIKPLSAVEAVPVRVDLRRSGVPGRPTSAQLVERELRDRASRGELKATLKAEVDVLSDWLHATHPTEPRMGAQAARNRFRVQYKELFATQKGRPKL